MPKGLPPPTSLGPWTLVFWQHLLACLKAQILIVDTYLVLTLV